MNGKIGWIEMYSDQSEASAAFYEKAFGWNIQRDPSMGDHIMFTGAGGCLGGGFAKDAPKLAAGIYILTDSMESSLSRAAGGEKVRDPTPISEEVGSWASFTDPPARWSACSSKTRGSRSSNDLPVRRSWRLLIV